MNAVMAASGVDGAIAVFDDCNVEKLQSKFEKCWKDTLSVLRMLVSYGFIVCKG